jgi:hypothetical protein
MKNVIPKLQKIEFNLKDGKKVFFNGITTKERDNKGRYIKGHPSRYLGANSPNWKGGYPNCEMCGHKLSNRKHKRCAKCRNFGRKLSESHRLKLSLSKLGSKNPQFKDGLARIIKRIRTMYKYRLWKRKVFERDNFTCVICGSKTRVVADHIVPFTFLIKSNGVIDIMSAYNCDSLWNICNGRTLCEPCHKKTDTWGRKSANYKIICH